MDKTKMSFGARVKESCRKMIVSLKHKPQNIPMLMLVITFLYYSLNLTHISDTTYTVSVSPMGLCGFITMLFSILSLVCFMNAYPNRKPVNKPMLILMYLMVAAILAADVIYVLTLIGSVAGPNATLTLTPAKVETLNQALQVLWVHGILLLVSVVLAALLPVYAKMIRKINTSIEVAAGKDIASIDISGED